MSDKSIKPVRRSRKLTPEEAARYKELREAADAEIPQVRGERTALAEPTGPNSLEDLLDLRKVFRSLREERVRQGLSLGELEERTGISRSRLSKLERCEDLNPTIGTITRYARALGKRVAVTLIDLEPDEAIAATRDHAGRA